MIDTSKIQIIEQNEAQFKKDFLPIIIDMWYGNEFNPQNKQHTGWLDRKIHAAFVNFGTAVCAYSDSGEPLGFLWYQHDTGIEGVSFSGKAAHIIQIGLYDHHQRKGIGTMLLGEVCNRIKQNGGECLYTDTYATDSREPIIFYIKNKFIPVAHLPGLNGVNDSGQFFLYKII